MHDNGQFTMEGETPALRAIDGPSPAEVAALKTRTDTAAAQLSAPALDYFTTTAEELILDAHEKAGRRPSPAQVQDLRARALRITQDGGHGLGYVTDPTAPVHLSHALKDLENGLGGKGDAWRIQDFLPLGGRLNLFAAPKAGKTTTVGNIVRALVDGENFLGRYTVDQEGEEGGVSVSVLDTEMTPGKLLAWYQALGLKNPGAVQLASLRGHVGELDFLDPDSPRYAALVDKYAGSDVYVLDPAGPLLAALGLDENSNEDVQRFLSAWDRFVEDLGGTESIVVHHAGHNGGRARGASAWIGSADMVATLTRGEDAARTAYLSTIGRGAELPKTRLYFDREDLRLTVTSADAQKAVSTREDDVAADRVEEALRDHPDGLGARALEDALRSQGLGRNAARGTIDRARRRGVIRREGSVQSYVYRLA